MNYPGVRTERIAALIENGLSPSELTNFIRSQKTQLLLAGEHPRQLPTDHAKAARWVARFSERGQAVFAKWILEETKDDAGPPVDQLAPRFRAIEREGVQFDPEAMRELCRRGLRALCGTSAPTPWLAFLGTDPYIPAEVASPSEVDAGPVPVAPQIESSESFERFVQWAQGEKSILEIPDGSLHLAAKLYVAARERDSGVIRDLPGDTARYAELNKLLSRPARASDETRGLHANAPGLQQYDPDKNYATLEIIATRPWRGSGQTFFLKVEAFVEIDAAFTLSNQDLAKAFPDRGEIILFQDLGVEPDIGRPAAYKVQRADTPGTVKFRVVSPGRPIIAVYYVPIAADNPDRIREWLADFSKTTHEITALFVLSDGLCIKPRAGALSRMSAPEYEWTFDAWAGMSAVEFHKAPYIVSRLPSPTHQYECAPLAISVRRLLRRMSERKAVNLTRQQMADIVEQVRVDRDATDDAHRQRIIGKLEALSRLEPEYDLLIADLMQTAVVQADIETRKQLEINNTSEELGRGRKALEQLRTDKQALQESISELKVQFDARVRKLRAAMRRAFEEAKAKEAETLAQVGLMQILRAEEFAGRERRRDRPIPGTAAPSVGVQRIEAQDAPTADAFRAAGFADDICGLYGEAVELCHKAGLPVILEGPGAAVVSIGISRCLGAGTTTVLDIPLGLASAEPFKSALEGHADGPLVLRNANLSDVSVYAGGLIDEVITYQVHSERGTLPRRLILAGATGPAALTWPVDLQDVALKIDLAASPYTLDRIADFHHFKPTSPVQGRAWGRLKTLAEDHAHGVRVELLLGALLKGKSISHDAD